MVAGVDAGEADDITLTATSPGVRVTRDEWPVAWDGDSTVVEFERMAPSASASRRRGASPRADDGEQAIHVPPVVDAVLRTAGQPLDAATLGYFEPRFGHDFSGVRVHADPAAGLSARAVNALAYTVGADVVFDRDRYAPATPKGRSLLAHELAHVVQQSDGVPSRRVFRQVNRADWGVLGPLTAMPDQQLQDRYDAIVEYFITAKQSTLGDDKIQSEAGEIGAILARRAGRTFDTADIARMRVFFESQELYCRSQRRCETATRRSEAEDRGQRGRDSEAAAGDRPCRRRARGRIPRRTWAADDRDAVASASSRERVGCGDGPGRW
jgi:hypothetical protein